LDERRQLWVFTAIGMSYGVQHHGGVVPNTIGQTISFLIGRIGIRQDTPEVHTNAIFLMFWALESFINDELREIASDLARIKSLCGNSKG